MNKEKMIVDIHQLPKSRIKTIFLAIQHVFAMFGANVLVPLLVNQAAGEEVIPIQVAFFASGLGTLIYLAITGFNVPIYLGSSFAYLGAMTTLWISSGYVVFISLMIVGVIYLIIALIIHLTKGASYIKKFLSPVIIGPVIIMIGLSLMGNAGNDSFLNPNQNYYGTDIKINTNDLWSLLTISILTFSCILFIFIFSKSFLRLIPILIAICFGLILSLIIWSIALSLNNHNLANTIFKPEKIKEIMEYENWKWYPDITNMWKMSPNVNGNWFFNPETLLSIVPLSIVTISEHIGDHINIGHLTNNDFISQKPGLSRTLIGDGLATIVSTSMGGPPNTSYGENTSVIAMTKIASVWVIAIAAIFSILIGFIPPISKIISLIPTPVIGGIEIILFSMIAVNGLKILIKNNIDFSNPKNILIFAILAVMSLGGVVFKFSESISLAGTGVGIIITLILNITIKYKDKETNEFIDSVDLSPIDIFSVFSKKKENKKNKKNKD
ncbi:MAG: uracil-xanthine permease family protein [Metamycoplasmataceae bacterium]